MLKGNNDKTHLSSIVGWEISIIPKTPTKTQQIKNQVLAYLIRWHSRRVVLFWAKDSRLVFSHPVHHAAPVLSHPVRWLPVKILHLHFLEIHLLVHAGLGRHRMLKQLHVVLCRHEERRFDGHGHLGHRGRGLVLAPHLASLLRYRHVWLCKRQRWHGHGDCAHLLVFIILGDKPSILDNKNELNTSYGIVSRKGI